MECQSARYDGFAAAALDSVALKQAKSESKLARLRHEQQADSSSFLPLGIALGDGDVAVDGQVLEALDRTARLRPFYFEPVEFCSWAEAEDHPRIVIGEIASTANLELVALEVAGAIRDLRADGISVALAPD